LVLAGRPIGRVEGVVLRAPPACDGSLRAFGPSGDGVEAVLACMERHQSNSTVQAMACWSLVNLALISQQKKFLCSQGGVLAIVRAMARHPGDSEVHFRAMFALINLVTPDVTSENIIQPNTMKVALSSACLPAYPSACLFICLSCQVSRLFDIDLAQAVVDTVVSAIQAFSDVVAIVNRGCLVLHNISLDQSNLNALVAFGAPEELLHAIGKHPTDALLLQCATSTLRRLGH
ncbi:unnamed protein product, partial [Hapterophycus canaliculatus]